MNGRVSDPIVIKIDADIEDARRKLAQFEKEAERSAGKIQRSFLRTSAAAGQGSAQGRAGSRSLASVPTRPDPGNNIRITTSRLTGEKNEAFKAHLAAAGLGAAASVTAGVPLPGARPAAGVLGVGAGLVELWAQLTERTDEQTTRVFTLNEALDTFDQNQTNANKTVEQGNRGLLDSGDALIDTTELLKQYNDALGENRAIIGGIVTARATFDRQISDLKRSNDGVLGNAPRAQDALRNLQATEKALRDIAAIVKDPATQEFLRLFRQGDGLGQPLTDERIDPRPLKSGFFDLGGGASPRRRQLAGLGISDAGGFGGGSFTHAASGGDLLFQELRFDRGEESLKLMVERLEEASTGFGELTQAASGFEAQGGALATLLGRTNVLFGEQSGLLGELGVQLPELGREFTTLLERTSQEAGTLNDVVEEVGRSFLDAFEGAIQRGESLSGVLKGLALDLAEIALKSAGNALLDSILGGLFGGGGSFVETGIGGPISSGGLFAKGAAFAGGRRLTALARGGALSNRILRRPTLFPLAGGLGLAGEAGPEAVLPLARMGSGELGVKAAMTRLPDVPSSFAGGAPVTNLTFNIDATGADEKAIRRVERLVQQAIAAINHDRAHFKGNVIGVVLDNRRRGGNIARAFGAR